MKKLIAVFGLLFASLVNAATPLPVVLGGTGASTATSALTNLGALSTATAASTYLTQASATSTYLPITTAASTYAPKSGNLSQFAATTSAQLAGVISDETGTGSAVFGTSPTITTPNIVGVTNAGNAPAGSVGEPLTASGSAVPLTTNVSANCTSKSLTAGDWDVSGVIEFAASGGAIIQSEYVSISQVSATLGGVGSRSSIVVTHAANAGDDIPSPVNQINVASTTPVYLVANATYTGGGAVAAYCTLLARRRH